MMTRFSFVLFFVVLTVLSWGVYGPVLHEGQHDMGVPLQPSSLRPFICVGIAYFLIAVVVPIVLLRTKREAGHWTASGAAWSFAAGAAGALGIIMAFDFGGKPVFVMPVVFGGAPGVNTFATMLWEGTYSQIKLPFFVSLALVVVGATSVLILAARYNKAERAGTTRRPEPFRSADHFIRLDQRPSGAFFSGASR